MTKYFLDTNIFIRAIANTHRPSERLYHDPSKEKYSNEYIIKEVRRVLKSHFGFSEFLIHRAIDDIRLKCTITSTPPPNRFKKLDMRDKSDRPIVQGAIDTKCILVTGDHHTYEDAKKSVISMTPDEVYQRRRD